MKLVLILFILIIIKLNNSKIIQFDNSIINECTEINPCNLQTNSVWLEGELPSDGDSVIIDFSTLNKNSNKQSIYIVGNGLEIQLLSFYLNGASDSGYNTNLVIQDSNININDIDGNGDPSESYFKIINVQQVIIKETNKASNNQIKVDNFISDEVNLVIEDYANIQICNLTINSQKDIQTVIQGASVVNVTQWVNFTASISHSSSEILNFKGNGLILNSFISTGTVQINSITIGSTNFDSEIMVNFNKILLDDFMYIAALNTVSINQVQFNSDNSSIYISTFSTLEIIGTINDEVTVNGSKIVILGDLLLPSGYIISILESTDPSLEMNGSIIIKDSQNPTYINEIDLKYLDIKSPGHIILNNSTLNNIISPLLNIQSNSIIETLNCTNTTTIEKGASLLLKSNSNCNTMNVYGLLSTILDYNGDTINVFQNGTVSSQGYIFANIINNSTIDLVSYNQTIKSIIVGEDGVVIVQAPGLQVNGSLFLEKSQLKLYYLSYNNPRNPAISVYGNVSIDLASLYLETQYISNYPKNNDKLYLIKSNGTVNIKINNSEISFSNFKSSFHKANLDYQLIKDKTGNVFIEFKENKKTLIIVLCVVIPLVLIAAVVLIVILKRRRLNNSERIPLNKY